jgi:uncharacterized protein (DUF1810 family)
MSDVINDPYNLERFVLAQNSVFEQVCDELRNGNKQNHWMWFIFPQISGLGHSPMAKKYAITSLKEAEAYLLHLILGPRLRTCTELVNAVEGRSIEQIFGYPDDLKFRSSMTLFAHASTDTRSFIEALKKYFDGQFDSSTTAILNK